ncbi:MAG: TonB-dependent receptor [Elusimicrobiota bacterium]
MKKLSMFSLALCLVIAAGFVPAVYGKDATTLLFEEIPIVEIASKKAETISEAPAIITVITAKDIKQMGYETLYDIIKTVPGVTITESFFGYSSISVRGIKENHYNNRTALLLNGLPIRDITVGSNYLEAIPVNVIARIEIIRGPGSVVYGNGAFSGVINVITKKSGDETSVSAGGGSKSAVNGDLTLIKETEQVNVVAAASYKSDAGYEAEVKDMAGVTAQMGAYDDDEDAMEDDFYNGFVSVEKGDLKLDVFHFNMERDKFGILPNHLMTGEVQIQGSGGALHYKKALGELELNSMLHYSMYSYDGRLNDFQAGTPWAGVKQQMQHSGNKYGLDVDGLVPVSDQVSLLAGISYEYQKTDPYEFIKNIDGTNSGLDAMLKEYDTTDMSVYTQLELTPAEPLKIVGGVRYSNNDIYGDAVVPRASAVYKAGEKVFIKALYGSAYRNPTFFEKYVNTKNVLYGDPNLTPEKIDTIELGINATLEQLKHNAVLTVFQLTTTDMIERSEKYFPGDTPPSQIEEQRVPDTSPTKAAGVPGYGNTDGQVVQGVELDMKGDLIEQKLTHKLNVSFKTGENSADKSDINFLDKLTANYILTLLTGDLTNSLSVNYVGERAGTAGGADVTLDAIALLNLKSTYDINENLSLSLTVLNILGSEVAYPDIVGTYVAEIPGDSGTNVYGSLSYKF